MSSSITVKDSGSLPVIALSGEVIEQHRTELRDTLKKVADGARDTVVIEVTDVQFIDSHGLGQILFFRRSLEERGLRCIILNKNTDPQGYMNKLFDITGLHQVLDIVTDLDNL
jgi:anti-anti-sigma factor